MQCASQRLNRVDSPLLFETPRFQFLPADSFRHGKLSFSDPFPTHNTSSSLIFDASICNSKLILTT